MTKVGKSKAADVGHAKDILRALTHKLRLRIIRYIDANPGTYVKAIYKDLKLEQSVTSQHLAILRNAGIVLAERDGKNIKYHLDYSRIKSIVSEVDIFLKK